jgi:eukaryotic-like serine/threonine-protein kinase
MAPSMMATRPPSATVSNSMSGTVQYMSPEQLNGDPGDHRSDIFAFGCVLYEMFAGRKAFEANTAIAAIAAIIGNEPPAIPALASAHPVVDHLMRRCLEKDPERRWQNVGDVARELRWVAAQPALAPAAAGPSRAPWTLWQRLAAGAAALIAVAIFGPLIMLAGLRLVNGEDAGTAALPALQLEITTPSTDDSFGAVAPDGTRIAFIAIKDHVPMLWVRPLDSEESRALPGTEGASFPFWSPDGASLGFFADNKLKRIDVASGAPIVITDAPTARGGDWGADGTILFAPGVNAPIKRVPARGGAVQQITTPDGVSGPSHRHPQFLPDGKHFLFSSGLGQPETNGTWFASLDRSAPVKISDDDYGVFVPPATLLTIGRRTLQASRFNASTGQVSGEPVTIAQDVTAGSFFGTSRTGTALLAYRHGSSQQRQLAWVNRRGEPLERLGAPVTVSIASPELSPDERFVSLFLHPTSGEDNDVWVYELARYLGRPITTGPPADAHALWDPDGQAVIFNSSRSGKPGITRFPVSGGAPSLLFNTSNIRGGGVLAMTSDRRYLLLRHQADQTGLDLIAVSVADGKTLPVTALAGDETEGQFSPDGKWVAYVAGLTGRPEVFVQPFPEGGTRTQVSTAGGTQVRWSADGKEIYYLAPDNKLMAAPFAFRGTTPELKVPVALFQTHLANGNNVIGNKAQYAVSRDGRFLLNTVVESPSPPIIVSVNWDKKLPR